MEVGGPQVNHAGHSGTSDSNDDIYMGRHHQSASVHYGSSYYSRILEQQRTEDKALAVRWISLRTAV